MPLPTNYINIFVSGVQTGTGTEQTIAHTLKKVPSAVFIVPAGDTRATWAAWSVTYGTHTASDLKITATSGVQYVAVALA